MGNFIFFPLLSLFSRKFYREMSQESIGKFYQAVRPFILPMVFVILRLSCFCDFATQEEPEKSGVVG